MRTYCSMTVHNRQCVQAFGRISRCGIRSCLVLSTNKSKYDKEVISSKSTHDYESSVEPGENEEACYAEEDGSNNEESITMKLGMGIIGLREVRILSTGHVDQSRSTRYQTKLFNTDESVRV